MATIQDIRALEDKIYEAVEEYLDNPDAYDRPVLHVYLDNDRFYEKLRHTFAHELRHHLEMLSGIRSLNKYDDQKLEMYERGMDIAEFHEPPIE